MTKQLAWNSACCWSFMPGGMGMSIAGKAGALPICAGCPKLGIAKPCAQPEACLCAALSTVRDTCAEHPVGPFCGGVYAAVALDASLYDT